MVSEYTVYKPTGQIPSASLALAGRPSSLDGKKVGLLFNSKPNADVLLRRVQERFEEAHPGSEFVFRSKPTAARPMADEVFEALSDCDVVVNAFGD